MMSRDTCVSVALLLCLLLAGATAQLTNEEYHQLPRLFHLDDYNRCLSRPAGEYCLGTLLLAPLRESHTVFNLMKIHSENRYNFNRTYIHRGYCLSTRCPSSARNSTLRFEQCGDALAQKHGMRATLHKLQYCRTHHEVNTVATPSSEQALYIQVLYAILVLNAVGTVYDVMTRDMSDKSNLLMAWSVPANWKRLTYISDGDDPRFAALLPLQGFKVIGMVSMIYAHVRCFHYSMFTSNPESLEELTKSPEGILMANGAILLHMFIMLTSFLTSYQLLIYSRTLSLGLHMLPICIIKRIIRITPVHMLMVGYAATWWGSAREGPLVSSTLGEYTRQCRHKFWTHLFFVNNIFDKDNICLPPAWYLAVDMHLYILACVLSLVMWRHRRHAMQIYGACFVLSVLFICVMCYVFKWLPAIMVTTSENTRKIFNGVESFTQYYTSSWGALPSCFAGLLMGHLQFEMEEKGIKNNQNKLFVVMHYLSAPLAVAWQQIQGNYAITQTSSAFAATFIAFERIVGLVLIFAFLFGLINIDSPQRRLLAWSKWQVLARMSLAVMLMNWLVGAVIAARPTVYGMSTLDAIVDWAATTFLTYTLAVPVTLLVEIPAQKLFNTLLIKQT